MGLPSGVQWASCNVGAERPSDPGLYFSWGNTEGHAEDDEYDFSQEVYDQTPAAAITDNLSLSQDAARANLGAPWRMPTSAEFQELVDNCTTLWTSLNGVRGRLFTSNVNGNSIFIPAAGFYNDSSLSGRDSYARYWSSSYDSAFNAKILGFNNTIVTPTSGGQRRLGFSVRAVLTPT